MSFRQKLDELAEDYLDIDDGNVEFKKGYQGYQFYLNQIIQLIETELIGEDEEVMKVHEFFKPRQKKIKFHGREFQDQSTAYDYVGGGVIGRNQLRAGMREKLKGE